MSVNDTIRALAQQIIALAQQIVALVPGLTAPPDPAAIATEAAFNTAYAAANPGDTLTVANTLVYTGLLTCSKAITIQGEGGIGLGRMNATDVIPQFTGGLYIPGSDVTLKRADRLRNSGEYRPHRL
jgi:hypothetical protein